QGGQGTEEQHGAELAAEWANTRGGINGHRLQLVTANLDRPESVVPAMASLAHAGGSVVVGTHGSAYSALAAAEASRRHMLIWETGAVGQVGWGPTPSAGNPYAPDASEKHGPA